MRNVAEVKTAADIREIFGLAAGGEAVAVEKEKYGGLPGVSADSSDFAAFLLSMPSSDGRDEQEAFPATSEPFLREIGF